MDLILFALWAFLPAGLANASPVIANRLPGFSKWNTPMDFGKSYRGKRIFGENKRFRGLLFGTLTGALIGYLQAAMFPEYGLKLEPISGLYMGALLGFGALLGDAVESFFKRQMDIPSGESWFPFDQLDYIFGGLLFASLIRPFTPKESIAIIIVWFALHVVTVYIFFLLKVRDKPI